MFRTQSQGNTAPTFTRRHSDIIPYQDLNRSNLSRDKSNLHCILSPIYGWRIFQKKSPGSSRTQHGNLYRLHHCGRLQFSATITDMINYTKLKNFVHTKHVEKIFDDIVDSKTQKYFEQRKDKKPLKRRHLKEEGSKCSRQKAEKYTDSELKLNWKTLMPFNAHR